MLVLTQRKGSCTFVFYKEKIVGTIKTIDITSANVILQLQTITESAQAETRIITLTKLKKDSPLIPIDIKEEAVQFQLCAYTPRYDLYPNSNYKLGLSAQKTIRFVREEVLLKS